MKRLIETDSSAFNELPYSVQSNADILLYACKIYGQDLYVPFDKEYFDKFELFKVENGVLVKIRTDYKN